MKALKQDPQISKLVTEFGTLPEITISKNLYEDILSSIVSQQLSVKAAATIWKRFLTLFPDQKVDAKLVLTLSDDAIRAQGISYPKIKYIKHVSDAYLNGSLDIERLNVLSDDEFIKELTKLKGVGVWTAEMILIFSLARPDVFSLGDLGLRNAVAKIYGIDRDDQVQIKKISDKWSPFRSTASRYLWKSLDNAPNK